MRYIISICWVYFVLAMGPASMWAGTTGPDSIQHALDSVRLQVRPPGPGSRLQLPDLDAQLASQLQFRPDTTGNTDDLSALLAEIGDGGNIARVQQARELIGDAISVGRFIQQLDSVAFQEFPVVLQEEIGNVTVSIVFDDLRLYPEYAQLSVVAGMDIPQKAVGADGDSTLTLYFGTPDLKFSYSGGIIGDARLGLFSNVAIGSNNDSKFGFILRAWHEYGSGEQLQDLGTYVTIDCDGFVQMGIEADVLFSRDWIVPVSANGTPQAQGRVHGHIQTTVNDWNNLLTEFSIPNFALTAYDDLAFNLSTVVLDFSDFANSPNVQFPPAYAEQHLLPDNANLWRGVYIENLEVMLPRQFRIKGCQETQQPNPQQGRSGQLLLDEEGEYALTWNPEPHSSGPAPPPASIAVPPTLPTKTEDNCRITAGVHHLLIDQHGVSGQFYAQDVLAIDQGSMDGWQFSVQDVNVTLEVSQVTALGFGGQLVIPVAKKEKPFAYAAHVNIPDRTYNFNLMTESTLEFSAFQMADVQLDSASYVHIEVTPTRFKPSAVLYGSAAVKAKWKNASDPDDGEIEQDPEKVILNIAKLRFEGIRLQTVGPYISLANNGHLALESDLDLANFPVSVGTPTFATLGNTRAKISISISLNLMNQEDNGFAATTGVSVVGIIQAEAGYQTWKYDRLELDSIFINISLPKLKIMGKAYIFRDHPDYGNGWQGTLHADIADGTFVLDMNAIFGNTDYRYWYVDALLESDKISVPIVPEVLWINGFGGGAYYHMRMDPGGGGDGGIGVTSSGLKYVPDEQITLGLKASVTLQAQGDALDGIATLELAFAGTSLQEIMFYGKAEIVSPKIDAIVGRFSQGLVDRIAKLPLAKQVLENQDKLDVDSPNNAILASLFLRMNFEAGFEFQGTFRAYIHAAEGVITGGGGVDLLASVPQNRWHLYVGGYTDNSIIASDGEVLPPVGVRIHYRNKPEVPDDDIIIDVGAYFLMGNDIPGPPPLHPLAAAFFGISSSSTNNRGDLSGQAALGTGFAFGAFAVVDFRIKLYKKKRNGNLKEKGWAQITGGFGFDVSLLKYGPDTYCSLSGDSPHGHKGWRATGRIWAFIEIDGRWGIVNIPNTGVGALLDADIPKPSNFYVQLSIKLLGFINVNVKVDVGRRCGPPHF